MNTKQQTAVACLCLFSCIRGPLQGCELVLNMLSFALRVYLNPSSKLKAQSILKRPPLTRLLQTPLLAMQNSRHAKTVTMGPCLYQFDLIHLKQRLQVSVRGNRDVQHDVAALGEGWDLNLNCFGWSMLLCVSFSDQQVLRSKAWSLVTAAINAL